MAKKVKSEKEISTKIIIKKPKEPELTPEQQKAALEWLDIHIIEGEVVD